LQKEANYPHLNCKRVL